MTDAKMGLEQDVPSTRPVDASWTIQTFSPEAETSGYPRPLVLYLPAYSVPIDAMYALVALACQVCVGK
jgi:hypothetical protein